MARVEINPRRARLVAAGWIGLGLLVAYAAWTALSLIWAVGAESTP
jgi:hypothetical protein